MITMALAKGRIYQETLPFLAAAGIYPVEDPEKSRKLMIATNRDDLRIVVIRATDVPTYVQYGAADIGVCGWDTLYEHGGKCRMSVAAPNGLDYDGLVRRGGRIRIATKFMKWARDYFAQQGVHVDLIKLYGSMELAPIAGLADAIVDIVATGATLKANNMREVRQIAPISSRLIVNQISMGLKRVELSPIIENIRKASNKND